MSFTYLSRAALSLLIVLLLAQDTIAFDDPAPRRHGFNALVFSKTAGFRHGSIGAGIDAVRELGIVHDFQVDDTEDASAFTDENLENYAVIIFLNTTGDILNTAQQGAFERFIQRGGGFVGIHSAADTEYDWPFYEGLIGAYFASHPPGTPTATIKVVDQKHPSTALLPKRWQRTDEWYNFRSNPRGNVHVLATLDESTYSGGTMGVDHPIAWCHGYEGGRSWYTAGGHTSEAFSEPLFRQHLLFGIEYAAGEAPGECTGTVWDSYDKVTLDANTQNPIALDIAADGRVFFLERTGSLRIYQPGTGTTSTAGSLPVVTSNEDGLIGIALDPNFETNQWVYLFYSPSTASDRQHVSRFTMNDNTMDLSSEEIVLEIPVQRAQCCHSGGALTFDPSGNLYIATGDNTNPFESSGFAPLDERPDRSPWDAQKSSGNTNDLRGKILRITPQPDGTYTIPDGNLFTDPNEGRPEIYVMGARNPFRISIDPDTGWLYWGEVGPDASSNSPTRGPRGYDEWNQTRSAGHFGWPYCIANNIPYRDYDFAAEAFGPAYDCAASVNDSPNNTGAQTLPPAQPAWIWYPYGPSAEFPGITGGNGRTAMAGPVFQYDRMLDSKKQFPSYFDNTLFIYEWARNWIHEVKLDDDGNVLAIQPFLPDVEFLRPIDMKIGPDGAMYVIEWGTGFGGNNADSRIVRIDHVEGSRAPVIVATALPTAGPSPLTVTFNAADTFDPDAGETVTFAWDFEADGIIDSTDPSPTHTYTNEGSFIATLTVTDTEGNSTAASFEITVGNSQPTVTLHTPSVGTFFDWGEPVSFALSVTDPEDGSTADGSIDCSNVTLQLFLGHDDHAHPLEQINDCEGTFVVTDEDHGGEGDRLFYVVEATYTDQGAGVAGTLTGRAQHLLQPKRIEAEHFTSQQGIQVEDNDDDLGGGQSIGFIDHGDYISFTPIDLFNIEALTFRISSDGLGGRITVRGDAVDGPILGTANVEVTGDWQLYRDVTIAIEDPGGLSELFFVFERIPGNSSLFNLNWIDFHGPGVHTDTETHGLTAEYFDTQDFTGPSETRRDAQINFNWSRSAPVEQFEADSFSARWTGTVTPEYNENYRFYTRSDDGMRVWLDGNLIINRWQDQTVTEVTSRARRLEAGRAYPLVVEYYDASGPAQAHLLWSSPSILQETVPYSALKPAEVGTSTEDPTVLPSDLALDPLYPNPLQDRGQISFTLPEAAEISLNVYDSLGRLIQTMHEGAMPSGRHTLAFHAGRLASGVYVCQLETPTGTQSRRFVVVR